MASTKKIIADKPPEDGQQWECQCARCGSSCDYDPCQECGDSGFTDEDTLDEMSPGELCGDCCGEGGSWHCLSSSAWCEANPVNGREHVPRGKLEWFVPQV